MVDDQIKAVHDVSVIISKVGMTCFRCKAWVSTQDIIEIDLVKKRVEYKCLKCGNRGFRTIPDRVPVTKDEKKADDSGTKKEPVIISCVACNKEIDMRYTIDGVCMFCFPAPRKIKKDENE